jgi:hypothetical protein
MSGDSDLSPLRQKNKAALVKMIHRRARPAPYDAGHAKHAEKNRK